MSYIFVSFLVCIFIFPLAFIYMLPAYIAEKLNNINHRAIGIVNFLFGWTIIGWFACLMWALLDERQDR